MGQSATIFISRPAAVVFNYVMEIAHDAQWRTGIVEAVYTSDEPLGVGTTGFDRIEANGREMVQTWTTFEYQPGVLARWTHESGPLRGSGGYICEESEDGTRFTLESHVKPTGWYRLLSPIFGKVARRQNLADVQKLKAILEGTT
jgi:Polyketide cyclase / dehydrase and lipid transport